MELPSGKQTGAEHRRNLEDELGQDYNSPGHGGGCGGQSGSDEGDES